MPLENLEEDASVPDECTRHDEMDCFAPGLVGDQGPLLRVASVVMLDLPKSLEVVKEELVRNGWYFQRDDVVKGRVAPWGRVKGPWPEKGCEVLGV